MAAIIVSRIISSVQDNRISLANAQFARAPAIGSTWNTLRIGVRWIMDTTGANLTGTPRLAVGVCSGTANLFGDATTTNFVGVASKATTWTISGNIYINSGGSMFGPATRVGSTLTVGAASADPGCRFCNDVASANRTAFFVDVIKGSPNFSISTFSPTSGITDMSLANFLILMETATPSFTNYSFQAPVTIAADEANGILNAVNVSWNRSAPVFEVCDVAVARLA